MGPTPLPAAPLSLLPVTDTTDIPAIKKYLAAIAQAKALEMNVEAKRIYLDNTWASWLTAYYAAKLGADAVPPNPPLAFEAWPSADGGRSNGGRRARRSARYRSMGASRTRRRRSGRSRIMSAMFHRAT